MFCNNCGSEINEGSKFCINCGVCVGENIGIENETSQGDFRANNLNISKATKKSGEISIGDNIKNHLNSAFTKFKVLPNKIKYCFVGGIVALIVLCIILCVVTSTPKLVGKWENGKVGYIMFTDDGNFFVDNDNISGTYSIDDSELIMAESSGDIIIYHYNIKENILTLTTDDGKTMAFFKGK